MTLLLQVILLKLAMILPGKTNPANLTVSTIPTTPVSRSRILNSQGNQGQPSISSTQENWNKNHLVPDNISR